jgi:hypothetical protein
MKRICGCCTLWIVCGVAGLAAGRAPLIDPPSPPPCAADGSCYPNRGEWGWYQARWRTWPGVNLEPTPAKRPTPIEGRVSPELGPSETPPAELEDAAAPPASPKREEAPEAPPGGEKPPAAEGGEPKLPTSPLQESTPLRELESHPPGPTTEVDPPPSLPRSLSARLPNAERKSSPSAVRGRAAASQVSTGDPPPTPPWAQSAAL